MGHGLSEILWLRTSFSSLTSAKRRGYEINSVPSGAQVRRFGLAGDGTGHHPLGCPVCPCPLAGPPIVLRTSPRPDFRASAAACSSVRVEGLGRSRPCAGPAIS